MSSLYYKTLWYYYYSISTGIPHKTRFLWQLKNHVSRNLSYAKQIFTFSNPLPSVVFDRVKWGITNSNLQAHKFALRETAL